MTDDHTREPGPTPPVAATAPRPDGVGAPPRWARAAVYGFGAIVGAAALLASGFDLYGLADALGFTRTTCVAVPVGLDAGASTTGVLWITAPAASAARRQWRGATLGLVGASAVLNGLSVLAGPHWLAAGATQGLPDVGLLSGAVAVVIAVVIAFAFPLVAAWMVHAVLAVRDAATRPTPTASPASDATSAADSGSRPAPAAIAASDGSSSSSPAPADSPSDSRASAVLPSAPADSSSPPETQEQRQDASPAEQDSAGAWPAGGPADAGDSTVDIAGEEDPIPAPPAPTGHKMADARAWFRHERARGRTPRPVEVNRAIGSDGYIKTSHIEHWERELDHEHTTGHSTEHEHPREDDPGAEEGGEAPAPRVPADRLRLVDTH